MIHRDKIDILSQILEAANGKRVTKTKMTYKVAISYVQLKEHLTVLTEKDLIHYDEYTQTFKTTEKGLRFLDLYNQISDMIKEEEQPSKPQRKMWLHG
jgi:predicted transcriptional regulator